ncbi:hypothetical protein C8F01DRAFT_1093817 [Mycena amicta]|nr:hypothetical protein C8F01DRAFT_1093817 [Mycena amicta]
MPVGSHTLLPLASRADLAHSALVAPQKLTWPLKTSPDLAMATLKQRRHMAQMRVQRARGKENTPPPSPRGPTTTKATSHKAKSVKSLNKTVAKAHRSYGELEHALAVAERKLRNAEARIRVSELKATIRDLEEQGKRSSASTAQLAGELVVRAPSSPPAFITKARGSRTSIHVSHMKAKRGRSYSTELRALARLMVRSGCKQGQVGTVMQEVARRAVLEGLVAAEIQLGFELKCAESFTISSDSTSRRNLNYKSHHIHLRPPVGLNADGSFRFSETAKTHAGGIASTVNHSTETSKSIWLEKLEGYTTRYSGSPLGRLHGFVNLRHLAKHLVGMCGAHANNEKALAGEMQKWKHEELLKELDEKAFNTLMQQVKELKQLQQQWFRKKIDDAGRLPGWMGLSEEERAIHDLATYHAMLRELGESELKKLDDDKRQTLTKWVWTGCCMHKEQNSFKGGNTRMNAYWKELGVDGPLILANKENAKAVHRVLHPEAGDGPVGDEDLQRFTNSAFGAAETAQPYRPTRASDKTLIFLAEQLGVPIKRFPPTSQTRFGSFGDASCELIARRKLYRQFLSEMSRLKVRPGFTNIELNVYNVLDDGPTLTELAILAIYYIFVAAPYMSRVRAPAEVALNAIHLGPLHREVVDHCQTLIDEPEAILDATKDDYARVTFNGELLGTERVEVMEEIKKLRAVGKLLYLREMLVAFLDSAKATWIRFSSEFAPGGLIDGLSDSQKGRVWLPATNDHNEGALGTFIVYMRNHPTATLLTQNALAMFVQNKTQEFMNNWFTPEDHQNLIVEAQRLDSAGLEQKQKHLQYEYDQRVLAEKHQKELDAAAKEARIQAALDTVPLIKSVDNVKKKWMTRDHLDEQLDKLRRMWNTNGVEKIKFPLKKDMKNCPEKQAALIAAFTTHLELLKVVQDPSASSSSSIEPPIELVREHWDADDAELEICVEDVAIF